MTASQPDRLALSWWRVATSILLIVALVLAIAAGRIVEAVVIGVLLAASRFPLGAWAYVARGDRR